jgi:hypothetical protein
MVQRVMCLVVVFDVMVRGTSWLAAQRSEWVGLY